MQFQARNDSLVEGDETFTFEVVPRNSRDTFANNESTISVTIFEDNDGVYE